MMNDKDKKSIALEIYQGIIDNLSDVEDKVAIIDIVNQIIKENGLAPEAGTKEATARLENRAGSNDEEISCPHCGEHEHVRPNGSSYGKKRYVCDECKRSFGTGSGRLQHGTKSSDSSWDRFLEGSVCGDTLEQLAEKCGISLATAHSWRLKVYQQVANSEAGKALQGIIQADEFYLSASFKGNKSCAKNLGNPVPEGIVPDYEKYGYRDYAHSRGRSGNKRGLSKDKICYATALDESRSVIGMPVCAGAVSAAGLDLAFGGRFDPAAVLVTDASTGGAKFAADNELAHIALNSKKGDSRTGQYNLQLVNALHSVIAEVTQSRRSFSTKHSELYITWQGWLLMNRQKKIADKVAILKGLSTAGKKPATVSDIRTRELPEHLHQITN